MKDRGFNQHQQSQSDIHPSKGWLQRTAVRSLPSNENEDKPSIVGESGLNRSFMHVPVHGNRLPAVQRSALARSASLPPFPQQLSQPTGTETRSVSLGEGVRQKKNEMTVNSKASSEVSRPNQTGLPDRLKTGIENLSSYSMDNVRVHYNSDRPARLQAHAYTQGPNIYIAPGQEKHMHHEAWHVVQQMQGRVKPTMQVMGTMSLNDEAAFEREADVMGAKALQLAYDDSSQSGCGRRAKVNAMPSVVQRYHRGVEHLSAQAKEAIANKLHTTDVKVSEDKQAIVHQLSDRAYMSDSVTVAKNGLTRTKDVLKLPVNNSKTLALYETRINEKFTDDCGETARKIMGIVNSTPSKDPQKFTTLGPSGVESALSPRDVKHVSQKELEKYQRNNYANPIIGQAYVIAPLKPSPSKIQFHWGAVVAKTREDTITYESFAGTEGTTFQMYRGKPKDTLDDNTLQTFHQNWSSVMLSQYDPQTFVVSQTTSEEEEETFHRIADYNPAIKPVGRSYDYQEFLQMLNEAIEKYHFEAKKLYEHIVNEMNKYEEDIWTRAWRENPYKEILIKYLGADLHSKLRNIWINGKN